MPSHESIFPIRGSIEVEAPPTLVTMDTGGDVFEALSSETARALVKHLYEDLSTASDLAEMMDTSLQNVQYHLTRLREAGLIEVVDTWYSQKGVEMDVYGPAADPLVICAGDTDGEASVRQVVDGIDSVGSHVQPAD